MKQFLTTLLALVVSLSIFSQCNDALTIPYFLNFDPVITISCEEYESLTIQPYDPCDSELDIAWVQDTIPGNCPSEVTYIRVWRVTDDYGNSAVEQQVIHVVDNIPPSISGVSDDITLTCGDQLFNFPSTPIIEDDCSGVLTTSQNSYISCTDSTTLLVFVWEATDICGNTTSDEFTVSIVNPNIVCDDSEDEDINSNLVAICHHMNNGSCQTIYVAPQAVQSHLNHGDYLGLCNGPCPTSTINFTPNLTPDTIFEINTVIENGERKNYAKIRNN
jgi:hypothetical protein